MYDRSVICRVSRTLWSVISTPMPFCLSREMISWMSAMAIGSIPVKGSSSRRKPGDVISARRTAGNASAQERVLDDARQIKQLHGLLEQRDPLGAGALSIAVTLGAGNHDHGRPGPRSHDLG